MRPPIIKAIFVIAGVWALAGGAIWLARHSKPTPEGVSRFVADHPLAGKGEKERQETLEKVAKDINTLQYEQRREVRMSRTLDRFFRQLTPEEQARFLDLTLPTGFRQMMEAFNKMDPLKRKEIVDKALADLQRHEGEGAPKTEDPNIQRIVDQGLRSFYSEASADVKMDLAPLIEQMQKNISGWR